MIRIMLILLSLAAVDTQAEWQKPSERYLNAYKKYSDSECPLAKSNIKHFVYFARNRGAIKDHSFLGSDAFSGAQIMYAWAQLEPSKGVYDFSVIESDLQYLKKHNKSLFIQIQDATFSKKYKAVPRYLFADEFNGGVEKQVADNGKHEGWVAKRWDTKVQERFFLLISELGKAFDNRIAGINLQESAINVNVTAESGFNGTSYLEALKGNMQALKSSFKYATKIQYANFMPGEWLPWEDKGFLKEMYRYGEEIGVGLGSPDLMPRRKAHLNHALAMMHEGAFSVPLSVAVQDGNYIGETNSHEKREKRKNIVPNLVAFAEDFLKVNYIFWSDQKPYFEEDVLPCFSG